MKMAPRVQTLGDIWWGGVDRSLFKHPLQNRRGCDIPLIQYDNGRVLSFVRFADGGVIYRGRP